MSGDAEVASSTTFAMYTRLTHFLLDVLLLSLPHESELCTHILNSVSEPVHASAQVDTQATLPLSRPIKGLDGSITGDLPIPKGTVVLTSFLGANRDETL